MKQKIYLAPFHGLTPYYYRNAFCKNFEGVDAVYAPFASNVGTGKINPSKLADIIPQNNKYNQCIPQILSNNADEILAYSNAISQFGHKELNWNLGCPFTRIAHKKKGAGMLLYPDDLFNILDKVLPNIPVSLSVKTRLGMNRPDELQAMMEKLNSYPISKLILHPRIGVRKYEGYADMEAFSNIASVSSLPMVYNGDITDLKSFSRFQSQLPGINEWMPGRGALINPFLPGAMRNGSYPPVEDRNQILKNFQHDLLEGCYQTKGNKRSVLGSMKAIWSYMGGMFENQSDLILRMKRTPDLDEFIKLADEILQAPTTMDIESWFRNMGRQISFEHHE